MIAATGAGAVALGAGLTWRYLLKDRGSPELSQLLVVLDANGEREQLICGLGELRLRSRTHWGWGSLARPLLLLFPAWSERRLQAAIDQFGGQLSKYTSSIQRHRENHSSQRKIWIRGGEPDQALLLPAQKALSELYRGFSILQRERRLGWNELGERYVKLTSLLTPTQIPNFELFERACETVDNWSWPLRFRQIVGTFPKEAIHHLLERLPKQGKIVDRIHEEWRKLCLQFNERRVTPTLFYRTMVMAIYHSGEISSAKSSSALGKMVCWLEESFQLPLLNQDNPSWQIQLSRREVVLGDLERISGAAVADLGACRLYEIGEEGEQLLVAWRNELALCRFIERSKLTVNSIDPAGLSARVARTFTLTSDEGRRLFRDSDLVKAIESLVLGKKMFNCPIDQAIRVNQERKLIVMAEPSKRGSFNPLLIEDFLIRISPEKSHQWMRQSGGGSCSKAEKYRRAVCGGYKMALTPEMDEELKSYANQFLDSCEDPKPSSEALLTWLWPKVVDRWRSEKGLIGRLTDSFLSQFEGKIRKNFHIKPSTSSATFLDELLKI